MEGLARLSPRKAMHLPSFSLGLQAEAGAPPVSTKRRPITREATYAR